MSEMKRYRVTIPMSLDTGPGTRVEATCLLATVVDATSHNEAFALASDAIMGRVSTSRGGIAGDDGSDHAQAEFLRLPPGTARPGGG